jgi:hypothetical protein
MKKRKKKRHHENPHIVRTWPEVAQEFRVRSGVTITPMGAFKICRRALEKIARELKVA